MPEYGQVTEYEQAVWNALTERELAMVRNFARSFGLSYDQRAMLAAELLDGGLFAAVADEDDGDV